uniref:Uncharacterized protein n=1 Tax=Anguilla anguilla TaxID=7936 RepID=A0A0E9U1K1_ANGAN
MNFKKKRKKEFIGKSDQSNVLNLKICHLIC